MELKEAPGLEGVVFTAHDFEPVRQWVQDRATNGEIVATPTRLYLPLGASNMVTADENDIIWFAPQAVTPNAFSLERR